MTPTIETPAHSAPSAPASAPASSTSPTSPRPHTAREAMANFDFNGVTDQVMNGGAAGKASREAPAVRPEIAKPSPQSTPIEQSQAEIVDSNAEASELDFDDELASLAQADPSQNKIELRRGRFDNLYQSHKAWTQVRDFLPTVADARAAYEKSIEFDQLFSDVASGDPAAVDSFLQYWTQNAPEGVVAMAERFPDVLRASNPQVYEALQTRILGDVIEANYLAAAQSGDPADFHKAQMFDWTQTGKYRQPADIKTPDPLQQREAQIAAREQAIAQRDQQAREAAARQWQNTTVNNIAKSVDSEILKTIGKAAEAFAPAVRNALLQQTRKAITEKIESDRVWMTDFNNKWNYAKKMGSQEFQDALRDHYLQKARTLVKAVAKPLFTDATRAAVQSNAAQHEKSRLASTQVAPNGGKPVNPGASSAVKPGASMQEKIAAHFAAQGF